jgi:tRNA nucleotidyltransferase/poly(A) polymerase
MYKIYKVGGCVRDKLLGINSKDIDFVFVISDISLLKGVSWGFKMMEDYMTQNGFTIFLSTPDCYTIRAKFPNDHKFSGMVADFVLARKEIGYFDGTRKPILELGTLYDDLQRRDFTLNAMAEDEEGNIIDPFGGQEDLKNGILKTPLPCHQTFNDDPLRILRAIRFSIVKGFKFSFDIEIIIHEFVYEQKMEVVSAERIREELYKCFKHDTLMTILVLNRYFRLRDYIFTKTNLWLKPTFEQ